MDLWNPIEASALLEAVALVGLGEESTILDIGCGKAGLLLDLVGEYGCRGIGVDPHPEGIEAASAAAKERGLEDRISLCAEAFDRTRHGEPSSDLILCIGSSQALGPLEQAIPKLHDLLPPGGHLLLADGYWQTKPSPEYLAFLGCEESEMRTFEALQDHLSAQGLQVLHARETSLEEWDRYEDTYAANLFRFLDEHPEDPDADVFRSRITAWRDAYLRLGRGTLGFGLFLLRRTD